MMDRALKERIIGAAVLVLFVVLVVPVFLNGPPASDEIVSERVPLPGQDDTRMQTVVLDRDRTAPVPAAGNNAAAEAAPQRQETTQAAAATPVPAANKPLPKPVVEPQPATAAPAAASSTGMWAVQLGSFSSQENAERLAAELRKQGFGAFVSQLDTRSGKLHRVRIGPQEDRASAEAVAERLRKAGHEGQVVPHP
jgi:DedD protein